MFVGEAPGFHEDKQGYPFVGQAGKLLDKLLAGIGLTRENVYIANVIKCRPPGNRDPQPDEIEACESHLFKQIELIEPKLIATLGNFATKLLSGKPHGITRVHGHPQETTLGGRAVTLYPIYHPAAALYTPAMLRTLEDDFRRIPGLLTEQSGTPAQVIQFPVARAARRFSAGRAARPLLAGAAPLRCARDRARVGLAEETERLAARLAAGLAPGDVVSSRGSSAPARRRSSAGPRARSASRGR